MGAPGHTAQLLTSFAGNASVSMSEWVSAVYRRPPSKARALALEKMGPYQQWRFSQEEATGRASCFLCFQSIPRGVAVRLLASSPLVMKTGDCKWLHLDCARGPGMFVESVCAPQVESARRKRKRTAAGVASGSAKCKLCKNLLSPAEPYCQMFRADDLEPYGRDRRNQLSRLYVHTECAAVVKRDLNWDSRFRPYQRLLLATIESRGADCQSAAPLVLAPLCLPRDILHSIGKQSREPHNTHRACAFGREVSSLLFCFGCSRASQGVVHHTITSPVHTVPLRVARGAD